MSYKECVFGDKHLLFYLELDSFYSCLKQRHQHGIFLVVVLFFISSIYLVFFNKHSVQIHDNNNKKDKANLVYININK